MGLGANGISLIPKIMYNSNINWNRTKTMEMNEALIYLQEALGLSAKTKTWPGSACLPLHLRAIEVRAVDANGFSFLLASLPITASHPDCENPVIRAITNTEQLPDPDALTVSFSLKPGKVHLFHAETGERIPFSTNHEVNSYE